MRRTAAAVAVLVALAVPARAQLDDRPRYVGQLLAAVQTMNQAARRSLVKELRIGARQKCRAAFSTPDVKCVLTVAQTICAARPSGQQARCRFVGDVAVTNFLAEKEWVDKNTRVNLMNNSDDFQAGMRKELRARYAGLVAGLTMMRGFTNDASMPSAIDRFCATRSKRRVLTWSRCVAAVVWYIATSPKPGAAAKAPANTPKQAPSNGRQP